MYVYLTIRVSFFEFHGFFLYISYYIVLLNVSNSSFSSGVLFKRSLTIPVLNIGAEMGSNRTITGKDQAGECEKTYWHAGSLAALWRPDITPCAPS